MGREAPVDDGWILIPFREPGFHFLAELLKGRDASILRPISAMLSPACSRQATAALRCEMNVNLVCDPFRFLWREEFVERSTDPSQDRFVHLDKRICNEVPHMVVQGKSDLHTIYE